MRKNDHVQTLFTPSVVLSGRSITIPTGSIGRIEEVQPDGRYVVLFDLPLATSEGTVFLYDEEKNTLGCIYERHELQLVERNRELTRSTLVYLVIKQDTVEVYDVSRCENDFDPTVNKDACPLLRTLNYDTYDIHALTFQAMVFCFRQGWHIENITKLLDKQNIINAIGAFQSYIMKEEDPYKKSLDTLRYRELASTYAGAYTNTGERSELEFLLLPYAQLSYIFMDCEDRAKDKYTNKKSMRQELEVLRGYIESLENVVCYLPKDRRERILERLDLYYRAAVVIRGWQRVLSQ